jgi:hypothetical protein
LKIAASAWTIIGGHGAAVDPSFPASAWIGWFGLIRIEINAAIGIAGHQPA